MDLARPRRDPDGFLAQPRVLDSEILTAQELQPKGLQPQPPRRPHYNEPEERFRGGGSLRDRRLYGPSGLLIRNLSLPPPSGQDPRKRTEPDDKPRKNHGVEPRANSEVFNRRSRTSHGSGGEEWTRERKRTSRMFPASRPQERMVSPKWHPAYLRESRAATGHSAERP